MNPYAIAIHGGAGTILQSTMTAEKETAYKRALEDAITAGETVLKDQGDSLDAVEVAIRSLEDNPLFNAGKGAVFNAEGKNEMDAAIMDGKTGMAGAVAGVTTIRNPITAARAVMEKSEHVMLTGKGAETFATEQGIEIVSPDYFFTQQRWNDYLKVKNRIVIDKLDAFDNFLQKVIKMIDFAQK